MKFGKSLIGAVLAASTLFSSAVVMAENHVVQAQLTNFKPVVIRVAPGDTVSWENMSGHIVNTNLVEKSGSYSFIPDGAEGWTSVMGENFTTPPLTKEGVYIYKCDPHWGAGMGGVIIVGEPTNLNVIQDTVKKNKIKGALKRLVKKTAKAVK